MTSVEFSELAKKRKEWVKSSKENKFDFDNILTDFYIESTHFIYELMQNAEDEGAKEVTFKLYKDHIDFYHNGKDFDIKDIDGVTGIGISKKRNDLNAIGEFGFGFKSVFAVTNTPYIFSGYYNIIIEDFVVPREIPSINTSGTLIRLPFNRKSGFKDEIYQFIYDKLENIDSKTMLFLKSINQINWSTPTSNGYYTKSSDNIESKLTTKKVIIESSRGKVKYLIFGENTIIDSNNFQVEVAFRLSNKTNNVESIVADPNSKLVVYFPTEKITHLNFIIQGPYKTTPNRDNIPLENATNQKILQATANLIAKSLHVIKDMGYLDVDFLDILPIVQKNKNQGQIYSVIYDRIKKEFLQSDLLPTEDNRHTNAYNALLARGKELTEFLNSSDIQSLFSKEFWLSTNITYDRTRNLRDYLVSELKIEEIDFEKFAKGISEQFLCDKPDEWIVKFYSKLLNQQSLWNVRDNYKGILRSKPIIRLEDGKHISPFDQNNNIRVYLPSKTTSKYNTVKRSIVKDEDALRFLKELGLTEPDLYAEVIAYIMPKYKEQSPVKNEDYFLDIEKIITLYKKLPPEQNRNFVNELKNLPFVISIQNNTNQESLQRPKDIYLRTNEIVEYFRDYTFVYFASDELANTFTSEKINNFLIHLGINRAPRRIRIEKKADLNWEEKIEYVGYQNRPVTHIDFEYEGLENILNNITKSKSILLWKLLINSIEHLNSRDARNFFKGCYKWYYRQENYKEINASFFMLLKEKAWIFDQKDTCHKPTEIAFHEMAEGYAKNGANIDVLKDLLRFKEEIVPNLTTEQQKKLEITKGYTCDELANLIEKHKNELAREENEKWICECNPEKANITINDWTPGSAPHTIFVSQEASEVKSETQQSGTQHKKVDKKTPDNKNIGRTGEESVLRILQEEYAKDGTIKHTNSGFYVDQGNSVIEVVWLNRFNDKGKGCDFIIKENGKIRAFIEVKSKVGQKPELIRITGTQWKYARLLNNKNRGEQYFVYIVLNTGKKDVNITKMRNPFKLWAEGKLYAHPVNLLL